MKKILVTGDVEGNFEYLSKKILQLQEKGQQFDFALCVGATLSLTFDIKSYINKTLKLPLKFYFIDSSELAPSLHVKYPDGGEICPNLVFLGKSGIKEIEGIKIAFLSGIQSTHYSELYSENNLPKVSYYGPYYTLGDISLIEEKIKMEKEAFRGVDIFLSNDWPKGFDNNIPKLDQPTRTASLHVSQIVDQLSPRYHFVAQEDVFFKRPPYINRLKFPSRLVALGKISGQSQYLSAFQMQPLSLTDAKDLQDVPPDATADPYALNISGTYL